MRNPAWRWLPAAALSALLVTVGVRAEVPPQIFDEIVDIDEDGPQIAPSSPATTPAKPDVVPVALASATCDAVATTQGDVLKGTVVSITPDGTLTLSGESYVGEAKVKLASVDRLALKSSPEDPGRDTVVLANGDRVMGTLSAITPKSVVLKSIFPAPIEIPRGFVASILLGQKTALPMATSDFSTGKMDPWQSRGGSWGVRDGALFSDGGGNSSLSLKLEQREAVTFVVNAFARDMPDLRISLVLFADTTDPPFGRNSVYAMFFRGQLQLGCARDGGASTIGGGGYGRGIREGTFRLAYDPSTGKAKAWFDSTLVGEADVPTKPAAGSYVMLCPQWPCGVRSLQVLRGVVAPGTQEAGAGEEEADTLIFGNKDRVSAKEVLFADGRFVVQTEFGRLTPKAENLGAILFRKKGIEEPRKQKGDVQVQSAAGTMTLQFKELTPEFLTGASASYGDVKIKRASIQGIRFNIYR